MFCQLAGVALPKDEPFDGEDLSQSFFGHVMARKNPLFWEYGRNPSFGYPKGRDRSPNVAVREGKWKLLVNADGTGAELYDLEADRNETVNVADKNPQTAKRLMEEALQWRKALP
jgi:arylsulfatase A-like enzyme